MKTIPRSSQKNWLRDRASRWICLCFFGVDSPLSVHYFDRSFMSGVKWWTHVSFMVINWPKNLTLLWQNIAKHSIETSSRRGLRSIMSTRTFNLAYNFLMFKFSAKIRCMLKCLPCLITRALSVDGHPIPFCTFSSPFLTWSPHLVDHCDVRLGKSRLNCAT